MNVNLPNAKNKSAEIDNKMDIEELERKIKNGEALLINVESKRMAGWIPLILSLGLVIAMFIKIPRGGIYVIITGCGLLYLGFNIWRLYSAEKQKKETESELKEYRDKKAELQAAITATDKYEQASKQQISRVSDQDIINLVTESQSKNNNDKISALSKLGMLISSDIETIQRVIKRSYRETVSCANCGFENPDTTNFCINCLSDIHWAKTNLHKFTGTPLDTVSIGLSSRRKRGIPDS
jgi:hypothetical protein